MGFTIHRWYFEKAMNEMLVPIGFVAFNVEVNEPQSLFGTQCMKIGSYCRLVMHIDFNFQRHNTQTCNTNTKSTSHYYPRLLSLINMSQYRIHNISMLSYNHNLFTLAQTRSFSSSFSFSSNPLLLSRRTPYIVCICLLP